MMKNCKCGHHGLDMVLSVLTWLAAIAFFWASWTTGVLLTQSADYYFMAAIVLAVLSAGMKKCGCCCGGMSCGKGMCGDCNMGEKKMGMGM
jgi:hypothetical protein